MTTRHETTCIPDCTSATVATMARAGTAQEPRREERLYRRREDWQERYLARYRDKGGQYRSARAVGVSWAVVNAEIHRNADFARALAEAREEHADLCEERMVDLGERSNNPVPYIVRLKALRPELYIERQVSFTVNANADLDDAQTNQLVAALVQSLTQGGSAVAALDAHEQKPAALPAAVSEVRSEGNGASATPRREVLDVQAELVVPVVDELAAPSSTPTRSARPRRSRKRAS